MCGGCVTLFFVLRCFVFVALCVCVVLCCALCAIRCVHVVRARLSVRMCVSLSVGVRVRAHSASLLPGTTTNPKLVRNQRFLCPVCRCACV